MQLYCKKGLKSPMTAAIEVDELGKRYLLGHQAERRVDTLRDRLAISGRRIVQHLRHPFLSAQVDNVEEFWALRDLSFSVQPGERLGIIGRNGAGKSTLLKILSRITEPTEGKFATHGRVSSLLEVGTGFHPELSGRENIFLNGAILGMSRADIKKKFDEIASFAEIEKFLDTPVKRYSSGMYVRLAFSVAAHLEPEILIVDEVLAVGDAAFQKKCLGKMEQVGQEGRTVLFVSHNMGAIRRLCDKGIFLDGGKLLFDGSAEAAIEAYQASSESSVETSGARDGLIRAVRVLSRGKSCHSIGVGDPLEVEIQTAGVAFSTQIGVGIAFFTESGEKVSSFNSFMRPFKQFEKNSGIAKVSIPKVPFYPGNYYIEVVIAVNREKVLERRENAAHIEILDNDYYAAGYPLNRYFGTTAVDGSWELE